MDEIRKLNDWSHARLRTEMYLGSRTPHTQKVLTYDEDGKATLTEMTWVPAVATALREIWENSLDECITHGHGNRIDVYYYGDGHFFVEDNGRGIPIHWRDDEGMHAATLALSETKAGRNFGERGASRGLNGVGAAVVNFCSEWMMVTIRRDNQIFTQRFSEGDGTNQSLVIEQPEIVPYSGNKTGTKVEFKLSKHVFSDMTLPESYVRSRLMEIALCYPKLRVFYNGNELGKRRIKDVFGERKSIGFDVNADGFEGRFWLVPNFFEDGGEHTHAIVNGIPLFNGGTHIDTFRRTIITGVLDALKSLRRKSKLEPNRSDITAGLLIYSIAEMREPLFDSQSKTRLINEEIATHVRKTFSDPDFLKSTLKQNPEWVDAIYEQCALRTQQRDDKDADRAAKKNLKTKIAKLKDAAGMDRSKCILFVAEGDSAVSGVVNARDPNIHGGLPLRGKIMNAFEINAKQALASKALADLMTAIGLIPGQKPIRKNLRYGKVFITTDADEDGRNIAALLINFFYKFWPDLFDPSQPPFIHVFDTPLIIAVKGKQRKYWYNDNYHEFDPEAHKGWEITRAKGLAALREEDWRYVLANPKTRPIVDDGHLGTALKLLFDGSLADARKTWIGL